MVKIILKDKHYFQEKMAENGFNLVVLSKRVGVSVGYLSMIVNMKKHPSAPLAKKLSEEINAEVKDVFFIC